MFDRSKEFALRSKRAGKQITVRFPTDAELIEHSRRIEIIRRSLGSGRGVETDIKGDDQAADWLVNLIRVAGSAEVDEAEAAYFLDRILASDVESCLVNEQAAEIKLRVCGPTFVVHRLRIPTLKEERAFNKSLAKPITLPNGVSRQRANLEPFADFYKLLSNGPSGYAAVDDAVPIIHKSAALNAMIAAMNALEVEEADENFTGTLTSGQPARPPDTSVTGS